MPEFPEVHVVIEKLKLKTLGRKILSVDVLRKQTIEGDIDDFKKKIIDGTIKDIEQVGKFLVFHFDNKNVLISHLRMEGKYFFKEENAKITKHDLVVFHLNGNNKLIYNDTRRFGRMSAESETDYMKVAPLNNVGPDPFKMKDASLLEKAFKNKTIPIKTALLDQSIMSGLGNIYTDEVLFETKVHPETPAKMVSRKKLEEILKSSRDVMGKAMEAGGSTIHSFQSEEGIAGDFQVQLKVYGKKDATCPNCGTKFRKIFVGGRGTTYCPHCQKNPGIPALFGVTGPIGSGKSTVSELIAKHGFIHLDCDEIVHDLYKTKAMQDKLSKMIPDLKISNGDIDRKWLKNYLIENQNKKKRLEQIVHKEVVAVVENKLKHSSKPIVLEATFLFETDLYLLCNKTIYVSANKKSQIEHLNNRSDDVEKALKLNANFNEDNKKKATLIIKNDTDVANLEKQVNAIFCK